MSSSFQKPLHTQHTSNSKDEHPCSQRDSNLRCQKSSCYRKNIRPHGYRDRLQWVFTSVVINVKAYVCVCVCVRVYIYIYIYIYIYALHWNALYANLIFTGGSKLITEPLYREYQRQLNGLRMVMIHTHTHTHAYVYIRTH